MRRYVSPDPIQANKGVLSASAIRELAPLIGNHINRRPNTTKVEPPNEITVPGLRTYTHIQVTGQIISRTVMPQDDPESPAEKKKKRPNQDLHCVATKLSHLATEQGIVYKLVCSVADRWVSGALHTPCKSVWFL